MNDANTETLFVNHSHILLIEDKDQRKICQCQIRWFEFRWKIQQRVDTSCDITECKICHESDFKAEKSGSKIWIQPPDCVSPQKFTQNRRELKQEAAQNLFMRRGHNSGGLTYNKGDDTCGEMKNTHVALDCRTCRSPRTQVYTDNQHLARSRPERGTAGTPLGWSLGRQMGG